jgi:aerobic-type carbon monoxide dehydrogenase small subunit (CoxS/CutS family)
MPAHVLIVNGQKRSVEAPAEESLLSVLRDRLHLTGTKYGCGEGQCGACTVRIGQKAVRSCRMKIADAAGEEVTTIEGLAQGGQLHPVQEAFLQAQTFQCAYCTSGMIMSAATLLATTPHPSDEEIIRYMDHNICRCGTYPRILAAVKAAARAPRKG